MTNRTCTVPGCDRRATSAKMCEGHRGRFRNYGETFPEKPLRSRQPRGTECSVIECGVKVHSKGMCAAHYRRSRAHGDPQAERPVISRIPEGKSWCPACQTLKDVSLFQSASDRHRGVASYCRECSTELRRTKYRDAIYAQQKRWRDANPERTAFYGRRYAQENREKRSALRKRLAGKNPELYARIARVADANRRARERGADGRASTQQVQDRWYYYGGKCWMCGDMAVETDHVKPLAKGGTHWPANLRPACRACNSRKRARWPYPLEVARERRAATGEGAPRAA